MGNAIGETRQLVSRLFSQAFLIILRERQTNLVLLGLSQRLKVVCHLAQLSAVDFIVALQAKA